MASDTADVVDPADGAVRDENGLTVDERKRWLARYGEIGALVALALAESPSPAEARRRVALLRLDLRVNEAAIDLVKWPRST